MTYEFSKVEGGFRHLDARELERVVPTGMTFDSFKSQLYDGHLVLLSDSPAVPALQTVKGRMGDAVWTVNPAATSQLSPQAQKAFVARTKMRGGGGASRNGSLHPPLPEPPYSPEPVVDDASGAPALAYEYRFEVACPESVLAAEVGCQFALGRTQGEAEIGSFDKQPSEQGTAFIARATTGHPRRLIIRIAAPEMGVSRRTPVSLKPTGKAAVRDAFIPVTPAVQLGARLGFPTEGYYYHFHEHRLVQEYCLLGEGRWGFYATRSTHEALNTEQGFNQYQGAILVFWKIDNQVADNQHLVYLKSPITRAQLDNLDEHWLTTHGVKLDIPALLAARKHDALAREQQADKAGPSETAPVTHRVLTDTETGKRESWMQIAEQYGLSAKALLALNPQYDADPLSLKAGDTLTVKTPQASAAPEPVKGLPPQSPETVSHAANVWYDYSERFLEGSTHKSINKPDSAAHGLPVVRLYDDSPQKVFAKSCLVEKGCIDIGSQEEPIRNFGPWAFFFGQANAAVPPPVVQGVATGQAAQTNMAMAATGAGEQTRSANEDAALALTRLAGDLKEALLSSHHLVAEGLSELFLLRPDDMGDNTQYTESELKDVQYAETRLRLTITRPESDYYPRVEAYHVDGEQARVPVRYVSVTPDTRYSVALGDGETGPTIYWTPSDTDVPALTTTPGQDDGVEIDNILVTPLPDEAGATVETFPESQKDWRDAILVFPDNSGIAPLYVVYSVNRGPDGRFAPSNEPKPSLDRPSLRADTKRQIEAGARKDANGQFVDKEDNIIEDWHYGHKEGLENRRVLRAADEVGMTQAELNDFMNAHPDYYQIEDAKTNLSHVNEKPGNGEIDKIIEHMEDFLENR